MTLLSASIAISLMASASRAVRPPIFGSSSTCQRRLIPASSMPLPMRCRTLLEHEIELAVDRLGAVDQEPKLHQDFANFALDLAGVDSLGGEMRQQRRQAGADAVVHVGRNFLPLRHRRLHDFKLRALLEFLEALDVGDRGQQGLEE